MSDEDEVDFKELLRDIVPREVSLGSFSRVPLAGYNPFAGDIHWPDIEYIAERPSHLGNVTFTLKAKGIKRNEDGQVIDRLSMRELAQYSDELTLTISLKRPNKKEESITLTKEDVLNASYDDLRESPNRFMGYQIFGLGSPDTTKAFIDHWTMILRDGYFDTVEAGSIAKRFAQHKAQLAELHPDQQPQTGHEAEMIEIPRLDGLDRKKPSTRLPVPAK